MVSMKELLGYKEMRTTRFAKACLCEAVGTAMLVIIGCGSVPTLNKGKDAETIAVAFAFGFALAMIIWLFGHISGGHVNPCVSIGFMITGHVSVLKCTCYIISQIAGALGGAGLLWAILPYEWRGNIGSTTLDKGLEIWQGVIIEIIATFCLVMTVFASCDRLRTDHSGSISLAIGFCVTCQICWMGTVTGGSMNPARSFGPAVVSGTWDSHWIYWVAPIVGGVIAALVYENIFAEKTKDTNSGLQTFQYNNFEMTHHGYLDYTLEVHVTEDKFSSSPLDFRGGQVYANVITDFERKKVAGSSSGAPEVSSQPSTSKSDRSVDHEVLLS